MLHQAARFPRARLAVAAALAWLALAVLAAVAFPAAPVFAAAAPTVTGVAPATGPAAGGTDVTITGTGFLTGAVVTFNGVVATGTTVVNSATITAITPAGTAGAATVIVTNPDGQGAALTGAFTYLGAQPLITGIAPAHGPATGGTTVTITGTGFLAGSAVRFGGTAATSVSVLDSTRIVAITPAHAAGPVTVDVTNPLAATASVAQGFTFDAAPPPVVVAVSPTSGTSGGGTPVTIAGTGFAAGATVRFGGVAATGVTVASTTQLTAVTPAHATGVVAVQVTNVDGQSGQLNNAFTYVTAPAPTVASVSPASGPLGGGNVVTVAGTGFLPGATVTFGGTGSTLVAVLSGTQLTARVPAASVPGAVTVRVTNTDGRSGSRTAAYTYLGPPTVDGVAPAAGPTTGGTVLTITGANFAAGATVSVGGLPATSVTVADSTRLTATTPAHAAGVVSVIVQVGGQQGVLPGAFTYRAPPVVSGVSPASGPTAGGTTITITGSNFSGGATVTVGGAPATGVVVVGATTIRATTPAHAAGIAAIVVRSADGVASTGSVSFLYVAPPVGTFDRLLSTPGINPAVWNGGSIEQLAAAAAQQGGITATVFVGGRAVVYVIGAPAFANATFTTMFAAGVPAGTIVLVAR